MNLKFLSSFFITVFIIFGTLLPFKANAVSSNSILVNIVPENPAPNENVDITLSSYSSNLDSVLITWSLNGKNTSGGIGKKSFSLNATDSGKEIVVIATISLPDGNIEKRIIVRPSVMVLLWQANDSFVPPFYKGKAMPTPDSEIKVVSMPEIRSKGSLLDINNMTYSWKLDYTNDQGNSGYGKNYFVYNNDYLDDINNISVVANTLDQKYSSQANINIRTTEPKILFYKNDTNMGTLWEQALSSGHRIENDEIIEAAPYFISPKEIRTPTLIWNWSINDNSIEVLDFRKNLIPLKTQTGVSGTAKIRLEINNTDKVFQTATKEINVEF
ncbi:MAG: hypothetical protein WC884_03210 [Candidatus Paceibacterota bacterium]